MLNNIPISAEILVFRSISEINWTYNVTIGLWIVKASTIKTR